MMYLKSLPLFVITVAFQIEAFSVRTGRPYRRPLTGNPNDPERAASNRHSVRRSTRISSFADTVEHGLIDRFGVGPPARIIESWNLLNRDYVHREFVGGLQRDPRSDESESNCHQHAHSYVPGLKARTFWDTSEFGWCGELAGKYGAIRKEFSSAMEDRTKLTSEGNNVWAGALTSDASGYGVGWKTLVLMDRGVWDPVNCNLFPETAKAIHASGVPATEVFFASMEARSDIKMHSDFTNFVLTSHLAVDIPESGKNKCRLTIGDDTRQWRNGEVMLFDTSIMHDAVNESDQTRYILMMRVWHPDLTEVEREALQFIYDCLEVPGLVSDDPGERYMAEREVDIRHSFPKLEVDKIKKGFGLKEKKIKGKKRKAASGGKGFGV